MCEENKYDDINIQAYSDTNDENEEMASIMCNVNLAIIRNKYIQYNSNVKYYCVMAYYSGDNNLAIQRNIMANNNNNQ